MLSSRRTLARPARLWLRRTTASALPADALSSSSPPLRVAVVGSGPAGMYVATSLLKKLGDGVRVDVIVSL